MMSTTQEARKKGECKNHLSAVCPGNCENCKKFRSAVSTVEQPYIGN